MMMSFATIASLANQVWHTNFWFLCVAAQIPRSRASKCSPVISTCRS